MKKQEFSDQINPNYPRDESAFRRIVLRSFEANPVGTENELIEMGRRDLLSSTKLDHQMGRRADD